MNILKRFVQSDIYLVLIAALGFLIWYFQPDISISASILFVVANFLLFTQKDSNGLLFVFLIMLVSNVAGNNVNLGDLNTILSQSNILITLSLIGIFGSDVSPVSSSGISSIRFDSAPNISPMLSIMLCGSNVSSSKFSIKVIY